MLFGNGRIFFSKVQVARPEKLRARSSQSEKAFEATYNNILKQNQEEVLSSLHLQFPSFLRWKDWLTIECFTMLTNCVKKLLFQAWDKPSCYRNSDAFMSHPPIFLSFQWNFISNNLSSTHHPLLPLSCYWYPIMAYLTGPPSQSSILSLPPQPLPPKDRLVNLIAGVSQCISGSAASSCLLSDITTDFVPISCWCTHFTLNTSAHQRTVFQVTPEIKQPQIVSIFCF